MMLSQAIGAADLILVDMYEIDRCSTLSDGRIRLGTFNNDYEWTCPDQELELDQDGETLLKDAKLNGIDCPEPPLITLRVYHGMTEEDIE